MKRHQLLPLVLVSLIFLLLLICQVHGYFADQLKPPDQQLHVWMSTLSEEKKNASIYSLALPGSHNSATYYLNPGLGIAPDIANETFFRLIHRKFPSLALGIVKRWSQTQDVDLINQLRLGIRYLDFRLGPAKRFPSLVDDIFIIHGLYGPSIRSCLQEIKWFTEHYPSELLIVHFQRLIDLSQESIDALVQFTENILGDHLIPNIYSETRYANLSLNFIHKLNKSIIVVLPDDVQANSCLMWTTRNLSNPWANTYSVDQLMPFLEQGLIDRDSKQFFVSQAILSATTPYILRHLTGSLETKLVAKVNPRLVEWSSGKINNVNIIAYDFIEWSQMKLTRQIINMNWL